MLDDLFPKREGRWQPCNADFTAVGQGATSGSLFMFLDMHMLAPHTSSVPDTMIINLHQRRGQTNLLIARIYWYAAGSRYGWGADSGWRYGEHMQN